MSDSSFAPYVVRPNDTIESALGLIEENRHRSVIVVDERGIVVGTLSDGDARKAILDHRLLTTPVHRVMNTNFIALSPGDVGRAGEIFGEEHIFLIPVVADDGRLMDVVTAY